jgi:hypothetical protein
LCNALRFAADFVVLEAVAVVQLDWNYEVSRLILPMQGFCHSLGFRSILVMGWTKMTPAGCLVEMCEARSLSCSFPCSCSCSGSGRRLSLRNEFPGSFLDSNAGSSQVTLKIYLGIGSFRIFGCLIGFGGIKFLYLQLLLIVAAVFSSAFGLFLLIVAQRVFIPV